MYIYKITNIQNGKFYIGKTKNNVESRWYKHLKDCQYNRTSKSLLYDAIRKYGKDSFKLEIISVHENLKQLNEAEIQAIASLKPQYNIAKGGDGGWINDQTGKTWKIKDTSRMGKHNIGKHLSVERKAKVSGSNNYQSTCDIHTPWGSFPTYKAAILQAKVLKQQGVPVVTDDNTLRKYCEKDTILHTEGRRTYPKWRGKSTRSLGFYKTKRD